MYMSNNILVGILCLAYNQKKYIKQCLDGFIMQKTNFNFMAYVGDDCSTDGTTEIIKEYEQKYPHIIKGIYHASNTGGVDNFFDVANSCKSKYVAWCEGDDYWIDEYKLQKQVDFLESNPTYTICFHPVKVVYEGFDFEKADEIYPPQKMIKQGTTFDLLLKCNFMQTNSVMYRWEFGNKSTDKYFPKYIIPGDWYMHLLHAKYGKIKMLPNVMSVYRRNPSGIFSDSISNIDKHYLRHGINLINFYYAIYSNIAGLSQEYLQNIFLPNLKKISDTYYRNKRLDKLQIIDEKYSQYLTKALAIENDTINKLKKKYKKYKKYFRIAISSLIISLLYIIMLQF